MDGLEKGKGNPTWGRGRLLPRSPDYKTWLIKPLWHAQSFHHQASGCEVLQDVHAPIPTRVLRVGTRARHRQFCPCGVRQGVYRSDIAYLAKPFAPVLGASVLPCFYHLLSGIWRSVLHGSEERTAKLLELMSLVTPQRHLDFPHGSWGFSIRADGCQGKGHGGKA